MPLPHIALAARTEPAIGAEGTTGALVHLVPPEVPICARLLARRRAFGTRVMARAVAPLIGCDEQGKLVPKQLADGAARQPVQERN